MKFIYMTYIFYFANHSSRVRLILEQCLNSFSAGSHVVEILLSTRFLLFSLANPLKNLILRVNGVVHSFNVEEFTLAQIIKVF